MKFRLRSLPLCGSLILLVTMAVFLLCGCGVFTPANTTPLPTVVLGSNNPTPQAAGHGGGVCQSRRGRTRRPSGGADAEKHRSGGVQSADVIPAPGALTKRLPIGRVKNE